MPSLAGFAENARILVRKAMLQSGVDHVTSKTKNTDERLYRHLIASHSLRMRLVALRMMPGSNF